jgi:hypothetical protein
MSATHGSARYDFPSVRHGNLFWLCVTVGLALIFVPKVAVDINILCRLFQHQCRRRAAFAGPISISEADSVVFAVRCSLAPADRDIDY